MASQTQLQSQTNIQLRPFSKLTGADRGWLWSRHHIQLQGGHFPWGDLEVFNDDTVQPGTGFPLHPHDNMEIISYVYQGAITHKDILGNEGRTEAGDIQVMTAGSGVVHSEYNHEEGVSKFMQIWLKTDRRNHEPSWGARVFPKEDRAGKLVVLASGFPEDKKTHDALPIHTTSRVLGAFLKTGQTTEYKLGVDRVSYIVPVRGGIEVNGVKVNGRDGIAIKNTESLELKALEDSEILMVDTNGPALY